MIIKHGGESYIRLASLYEAEMDPALMIPFHGVKLPVIVRRLTYAQIRACGDFSLIETVSDIIKKKKGNATTKQMYDYSELQYNILKRSLKAPTYEEIMSLSEADILRIHAEKELKELEGIINNLPAGPEKDKLKEKYYITLTNSKFLLPADFVSAVVSFALNSSGTDIKEVTEDMLFEAAYKAVKGHDNPADHLPGNFSDFNKEDINNRAWIIYSQRTEENGSTSRRR
jgi:hypothetical protein